MRSIASDGPDTAASGAPELQVGPPRLGGPNGSQQKPPSKSRIHHPRTSVYVAKMNRAMELGTEKRFHMLKMTVIMMAM